MRIHSISTERPEYSSFWFASMTISQIGFQRTFEMKAVENHHHEKERKHDYARHNSRSYIFYYNFAYCDHFEIIITINDGLHSLRL